ncbi:MAG: TIGR03663 family protein [Acidobacteria bacterium]|nr:MAG: TIGR03663 family protein [Acidobacteriota bacterium]
MSRAAFSVLFAGALALGLAFRLAGLDARPMHHDEANQAVKFGALLEEGEYRYDRTDHHGPTLYYLTLPAAWLRGRSTLASLDERTIRLVPAAFGAGLILLFLLLQRRLGRTAVAAAALLAAVSPALTYYSRFYIQESMFAFFTFAFLVALGRYAEHPAAGRAALAGLLAGLAYATKETSVIVVAAGLAACFVARGWGAVVRAAEPAGVRGYRWTDLTLALSAALAVSFLFYSSFFANPAGFVESILAFSVYFQRGVEASGHAQPWDYYLRMLSWSAAGGLVWTEAFILALGAAGTVWAFMTREPGTFWPRFIALYSWIAAVIFSALRYKTPWNLLPFHAGFVLMAGIGIAAVGKAGGGRPTGGTTVPGRQLRAAIAGVVLLAGAAHLGLQSWRGNFRYAADPRNPYVYAHTSPDFLRLVDRVENLSAVHPNREAMLVKVFAGPYEQWPLPWYLRGMSRVGYWRLAAQAGTLEAHVVIASQENTAAVEAALGDRYVSEFYGLRPGVLLTAYIDRTLWERFLASRRSPHE